MFIFINIIIGLFLLFIFAQVIKDIKSPPFILTGMWTLIFIVIFFYWGGDSLLNQVAFLFYPLGLVLFSLGFSLFGHKRGYVEIQEGTRKTSYRFNRLFIQSFTLFCLFITLLYFFYVYRFIQSVDTDRNVWQVLQQSKGLGDFKVPVLFAYLRMPITVVSIYMAILYFSNPLKENRRYFYLYIIMSLFFVFVAGNRGAIFSYILSIVFSYLIVRNFNNAKLLKVFMYLGLSLLGIFALSSFAKFVYEDQSDTVNFLNHHIKLYFTGSPIAFVEWLNNYHLYLYGDNTFRFFYSVAKSLGFDVNVTELVQERIQIGDIETNVYTIYHFYAADFGVWFAFLIQLFIGICYGWLYRKAVYSSQFNIFSIALLSMLYFPLINQFFDDKYISLTSTWIQSVFWLWLFSRREFLLTTDESE